MKKLFTFFIITATSFPLFAQEMYDNFQDVRIVDYGFRHGEHFEYTGNPNPGGVNASETVAWYVRNPAELFDVIVIETGVMVDVTPYVNGTKKMQLDIFSPAAGIPVQITIEDSSLANVAFPGGRHSIYLDTTTVGNAWETLTFHFDTEPDPTVPDISVNRVVLLFNPNTNTTNNYYWDNLRGPELVNNPCTGVTPNPQMLDDFECNQNVNVTFRHGVMSRMFNPSQVGNTSTHAVRYERNGGELDDVIVGSFAGGALDLTNFNQFSLDVYDLNAPSTITLAIQDQFGMDIITFTDSVLTSNQWVTFSWDGSSVSGNTNATQFVLLYEPGEFVSEIVYYDNFKVVSATGISNPTAIEEATIQLYPNPTNNQVLVEYQINESADVEISLLDVQGKEIKSLWKGYQSVGPHSHTFDLSGLQSQMYFLRLETDHNVTTRKLLLAK